MKTTYKCLVLLGLLLTGCATAAPVQTEICHFPINAPEDYYSIFVSKQDLSDHLSHGDILHPCPRESTSIRYEEGEYVPTLVGEVGGDYTTGGGQTIFAYALFGQVCHVQGRIYIVSATDPEGQLRLSLPFRSKDFTEKADTFYMPFTIYNHGGSIVAAQLEFVGGNSYARLARISHTGNPMRILASEVDDSFWIAVSFSYFIK